MTDSKLLDLSKPTALLAIGLMLVILVMVLPVPDEKLWRWMLPAPKPIQDDTIKGGHHGV